MEQGDTGDSVAQGIVDTGSIGVTELVGNTTEFNVSDLLVCNVDL